VQDGYSCPKLLNYLVQARNVTEHSISPVIKEWDANLTATPVSGGIQLNWAPLIALS